MCFHAEIASTDVTLDVLTGCLVIVGLFQVIFVVWTGFFIKSQVLAQKRAERAWLIISLDQGPVALLLAQGGQYVTNPASFEILNVGRTPAHSVNILARCLTIKALGDLPPAPDYDKTEPFGVTILVPGDSIGIQLERLFFNDQELRAIYTGNQFIYSHIRVEYWDTFGDRHEAKTGFVFPYIKDGETDYTGTKARRWEPPGYDEST
jgi:hypothetical protein